MANNESAIVLGFPRWTPKVAFSAPDGAAVDAEYPPPNLGSLPLAQVWRTPDLAPVNTRVMGVLDKPRAMRLLGLCNHNFSLTARYRLRLYLSTVLTGTPVYDSGWAAVWPPVYPYSTLEWEDDNYWSGGYSKEEIAGYRWTRPLWLPHPYVARSFLMELDDPNNDDGYLQCGLFEVSQGWQASVSINQGAQLGFRFRSPSTEAIGGNKDFERRDKPRVLKGEIGLIDHNEAMAKAFEHQRQMDEDVPFLVVLDPTTLSLRECFLARNVQPGLISLASGSADRIPVSFEEVM